MALLIALPASGQIDPIDPTADQAPEEPERRSSIEEIVILGSRKQSLQQVPISVTAFSSSELKELRIQNIADLSDHTPNLEINTAFAASNPTLFIRGIGLKDYNANSASAVAVYMDGIAINSPAGQLFQMFDVESVEVLRGPQGSLYGRNATAGAIVVKSFRPDGEWRSNGSLTYGNYNDVEVEGAISFPVFEEKLQGRVAFTYQQRDGYTKNACSGWDPTLYGKDALTQETMQAAYFGPPAVNAKRNKATGLVTLGKNPSDIPLTPDGVCILGSPGVIVNRVGAEELNTALKPNGEPVSQRLFGKNYPEGFLLTDQATNIPTLEDLQKLKPYTNNADSWAARMLLRSEFQWPSGGLELLLNLHGGQNRGDSFHEQGYGASGADCTTENQFGCELTPEGNIRVQGYQAATIGTWNEMNCDNPVTPLTNTPGCHYPGEDGEVVPGLTILATDQDGTQFRTPGGTRGSDERLGWYNRDGLEKIDVMGVGLTALAEFDSYDWWAPSHLTWISGYEWNDRLVELDGDSTPQKLLESDINDSAWQISSEIRLENESSRWQWTVGGFFLREKLMASNVYPGTLGARIEQSFDQVLLSLAPFLSARYDFTESLLGLGVPDTLADWNIKAGVRYNWENKTFLLSSLFVFGNGDTSENFADSGEERTWTGVTGDATLSWNPNETTTLYAKYSRGMKGGHFNAGLTIQRERCQEINGVPTESCQTVTAVPPEFIHAVEGGLKGRYFDGRLQLTSAFFRYWYTNLQVFDIVNAPGQIPTQQLLSSDANVKGFELEFDARPFSGIYAPMDAFFMRMGVAYLDSEFVDFKVQKQVRPGTPMNPGRNGTFDYSGNPLIASPSWKFSGTINWEIPISRFGSIVPQYSFSYRSLVSLEPTANQIFTQPAYWLQNARLAYRTPDQRIEIAAWVRNFTDELYLNDIFDLTRQFGLVLQIYAPPRMFGITASYDW